MFYLRSTHIKTSKGKLPVGRVHVLRSCVRLPLTLVSDLDVVPRSNPAVVSVPPTIHIDLVDLAEKAHSLAFPRVDILQLLHDVDVSSWKVFKPSPQPCVQREDIFSRCHKSVKWIVKVTRRHLTSDAESARGLKAVSLKTVQACVSQGDPFQDEGVLLPMSADATAGL